MFSLLFTDLPIMRRVRFAVATANARSEVKAVAHYVTSAPGGAEALGGNPQALRDGRVKLRP